MKDIYGEHFPALCTETMRQSLHIGKRYVSKSVLVECIIIHLIKISIVRTEGATSCKLLYGINLKYKQTIYIARNKNVSLCLVFLQDV